MQGFDLGFSDLPQAFARATGEELEVAVADHDAVPVPVGGADEEVLDSVAVLVGHGGEGDAGAGAAVGPLAAPQAIGLLAAVGRKEGVEGVDSIAGDDVRVTVPVQVAGKGQAVAEATVLAEVRDAAVDL